MFAVKVATLLAVASAVFASPYPGSGSSCSGGTVSCCNVDQTTGSGETGSAASGLLGAVVGAVVPIGATCVPVNVIGLGGQSCSSQAACCQNVSGGLLGVDCDPINIGL